MRVRTILRWASASLMAVVSAALATPAAAKVPSTLTHQGRLYDAAQKPVNGTLDVTIALYDKEGAETPIWSEVHQVTFEEGFFSLQLGSIAPFPSTVFDGSVRYMG